MKEFPSEVIESVISFLHLSDKLTCILVCKNWYEIITTSSLHYKVKFNNADKFNTALDLFHQRQCMGKYVHHISILYYMDIRAQVLIGLPILFPNIHCLEFVEDGKERERPTDCPTSLIDEQTLQEWRYIERIVDSQIQFRIATSLLGSCVCRNLKHLEVRFDDFTYTDNAADDRMYNRFMLQELVKNIHNAPSLEWIALKETAIKLNDLEDLHDGLPKLEHLTLEEVYMYMEREADIVVKKPALKLKSFSMKFTGREASYYNIEEFKHTIGKWLSYLGQKCQNLQRLKLISYEIGPFIDSVTLGHNLACAVSSITSIISYEISRPYPLKIGLLNAMDEKNIELQEMKVHEPREQDLNILLQLLQSATSTIRIKTLELHNIRHDRRLVPLRELHSLFQKLAHLTHLSIFFGGPCDLFFEILQNLKTLETLVYRPLDFHHCDNEHLMTNKTLKHCKIKVVDIRVIPSEFLRQTNRKLDIILRSCLFLEQFRLTGNFYIFYSFNEEVYAGALNLCFLHHTQLKYISIDVFGCMYYTFNEKPWEEAKRWTSFNNDSAIELSSTRQPECKMFHINLDCLPSNWVKMDLAQVRPCSED